MSSSVSLQPSLSSSRSSTSLESAFMLMFISSGLPSRSYRQQRGRMGNHLAQPDNRTQSGSPLTNSRPIAPPIVVGIFVFDVIKAPVSVRIVHLKQTIKRKRGFAATGSSSSMMPSCHRRHLGLVGRLCTRLGHGPSKRWRSNRRQLASSYRSGTPSPSLSVMFGTDEELFGFER